ncbi:ABC transporter substrate-binding protein [Azospirillum doebereinerae]
MERAKSSTFRRISWALNIVMLCGTLLVPANASALDRVRIGVINDQSGPYADAFGKGSVLAARMAVQDFGETALDGKIEIVAADHQNKADIGAGVVRKWFDSDGVDMAIDFGNSAVSLAVQEIAKAANKIVIHTSATPDLTQKACIPTGFSWAHDSYALAASPVRSLIKQGLDKWFFIANDYAFGSSIIADTSRAIKESGGSVVGVIRHPINAGDFGSYLLQAQASKANVISFGNAGADLANSLKQAQEFGVVEAGQRIVAPLVFITDVHSMGLAVTQGLSFVTPFYWDRTDASRSFGKRFLAQHGTMPTMSHAAVYSGVLHYLKAVKAAGTSKTEAVVAKMRELPVEDMFADKGYIRADGRVMHDLYLVQVKTPAESKAPWDYYNVLGTIKAEDAFRPLSESECPLVKK